MSPPKPTQHEQMSGAVDQQTFEDVIRANLSPQAITAIIALLHLADNYRKPENRSAIDQVNWLRDTLLEMLGVEQYNALLDQIGL